MFDALLPEYLDYWTMADGAIEFPLSGSQVQRCQMTATQVPGQVCWGEGKFAFLDAHLLLPAQVLAL
jgi:hypothetical protein